MNPRSRDRRAGHRSGLRLWLVPIAILGGIAVAGFGLFYFIDHYYTGGAYDAKDTGPLGRLMGYEPALISALSRVNTVAELVDRVLHTVESPAYVAGTRYGLPDELPLDWASFIDAFNTVLDSGSNSRSPVSPMAP